MRPITALPTLAAVAMQLCAASPTYGQTAADPQRQAQLRAAVDAHVAGEHARALALATQALSARESGTLHGVIARELAELGRDAEALAHAEACVRDAPAQRPSRDRDAILVHCVAQVTALTARVGTLAVRVSPSPPGVRIEVAGRVTEAAESSVRVGPGRVAVVASAPGFVTYRQEIEVVGGASVTLPVTLEALPHEAPPLRTEAARRPPPPEPPGPPPTPTTRRHPLGYILAGVGAASLIVGGVSWAVGGEICSGSSNASSGGCALRQEEDRSTVRALDTATTVALVSGVSLLAIGATLFFTLRTTDARAPTPRLSVSVGPGSAGLSGTF